MCILFTTVKLVRALSYVLSYRCSSRIRTSGRSLPRTFTDVMVDGSARIVDYYDIGQMLERDLFGGCWELTSPSKNMTMAPECVFVYPSIETRYGRILNARESYIDARGAHIVMHGAHKARIVRTFLTSERPGKLPRLCEEDSSSDEDEEPEMFARC
jgi:hypothetical protein